MRVKRPVIIPHSRVRGASLRRRRPRWTLRTALSYIFPPKHTNKYGVTKNIYIFKILYFENFLLPFFGALGAPAPYCEPPQIFPRIYPTFTSNVTHTPPWQNTHEKVERPRPNITAFLVLTCDVCEFTRVWYISVHERWANPGRQIARAAKFCALKLSYYSPVRPTML